MLPLETLQAFEAFLAERALRSTRAATLKRLDVVEGMSANAFGSGEDSDALTGTALFFEELAGFGCWDATGSWVGVGIHAAEIAELCEGI